MCAVYVWCALAVADGPVRTVANPSSIAVFQGRNPAKPLREPVTSRHSGCTNLHVPRRFREMTRTVGAALGLLLVLLFFAAVAIESARGAAPAVTYAASK